MTAPLRDWLGRVIGTAGTEVATEAELLDPQSPVGAALRAALVPFWTPGEAVQAGTVRVTALGVPITRTTTGTTRAAYDSTEAALWTATALPTAGGTLSGRLAFAANQGIDLYSDSPTNASIPVLNFRMTTAYDRPWPKWYDQNNRLQAMLGWHDLDYASGESHHRFEIKTSDDPTGATPGNMVTRYSIDSDTADAWHKFSGNVQFDGNRSLQQFTLSRQPTETPTAGAPLRFRAGGASTGGTNLAGGNLILSPGTSTGNNRGGIEFYTTRQGASGTQDNEPALAAYLANSGSASNNMILALQATTSFTGTPFPNSVAISEHNDGGLCAYRRTVADSAGKNLTVQASGATAGSTNRPGGSVFLKAGISTGTTEGQVVVQTTTPTTSGTADNPYATRAIFDSTGAQFTGNRINVATSKTPASATAAGTAGDICWDAGFVYVCTAANTWKRAALTTW